MSIEGFTLLPMSTTMSVLSVCETEPEQSPENDERVALMHTVVPIQRGSDPVVPREAVQLHLAAAHPEGEVGVGPSLLLVPVHVQVGASEDTQEAVTAS